MRAPGDAVPLEGWMTSTEAARRLGIKRETLYAYVARGMLTSRRVPGGRESRFDPTEISSLAARARSGGRAGALEVVIDSGLTFLDPAGHLYYRGWDVAAGCAEVTFEQVAEWLWGVGNLGDVDDIGDIGDIGDIARLSPTAGGKPRFESPAAGLDAARRAAASLATDVRPIERLRVGITAAATADPLRFDRRPEAVAATGRRIVSILANVLPPAGGPATDPAGEPPALAPAGPGLPPPPASIAERLWARLCPRPATPEGLSVLDAALVLLADHEMASSTLAARVAASTWANPYLVVAAGFAILGGPLHGGVADRVVPLLTDAANRGAEEALAGKWRVGEEVAGFGHRVYTGRDPRADVLWELVRRAWPEEAVVSATADMISIVISQAPTFPNVDIALAALVAAAGMREGAGEVIFATARTVGWLAHAIEEYSHKLRFRLRAAYTGPTPRGAAV